MSDPYAEPHVAEGKIGIAIERLASEFPFHAAILERLKIQARPDVGTMAVTVAGDDVLLLHNPGFVLGITTDELGGVLLHEVHHVLFGHVLAGPADFPDEWARTVAEEVTVNEFIKLPLPGQPITLDWFPWLPPSESTGERYQRLKGHDRRQQIVSPDTATSGQESDRSGTANTEGTTGPKSGDASRGGRKKGANKAPTGSGKATTGSSPQAGRGSSNRGKPEAPAQTVDDHTVWAEARNDLPRSREAIREVVAHALLAVGSGRLPGSLSQALTALGIGHDPGLEQEEFQGLDQGHLDWGRLLRRYVGQVLDVRPTFSRPPRRFPDLVGIVPGQRRQPARPKILAVIDTSGSITHELLERIDAELARLARRYTVKVVECDTLIHRVYRYHGRLGSAQGRGGTDLRPPFKRSFLRRHRPDLVIYFTDGFGPVPRSRPRFPVIWCLVSDGEAPATWGRVIWMDGRPRSKDGGQA